MPTAVLCSKFLRILFPAVIFTGVAFSFVGILQSMDEFGIPAAMSVASNIIVILYYVFFNKKFGIYTAIDGGKIFRNEFLLENDDRFVGQQPKRTFIGYRYHGGISDHLPIYIDLFPSKQNR